MLPNNVKVVNMEVENGRAAVELALPDFPDKKQNGYFEVYLWEVGVAPTGQGVNELSVCRQPAFYCAYPMKEDDTCVIQMVRPHLWEGVEKPYLYRLEVYTSVGNDPEISFEQQSNRELIYNHPVAVRTLKEIPEKGYFLNGSPFVPKCVFYDGIYDIYDKGAAIFWEGLMQKLQILAQMGANTIVLGSGSGMSQQEWTILQEYCDRVGVLLYVRDFADDSGICGTGDTFGRCIKSDICVNGGELFESQGIPSDRFYWCKAKWSRESFVYISAKSLRKHSDGSYQLEVYSNCKKVTLMVNQKVFGVQEGGGELLFQDIQIKGFPVDITAQAGECSMTIRSYESSWKV